jgi:uncharacterized protein with GYD domain
MADYMIQLNYTAEAVAALVAHPQNRLEVVQKSIESLGGKVQGFWMSFGEYDVVGIMEMPNNVSAAAFSMAIAAGGACHNIKTTPLLKLEDALKAMKKAGGTGYKPVTSTE